jgi:hypothetical protein
MFTTYRNSTSYDEIRDLVPPPNSYCIVNLLVLRTTWWWPTYKAETCSYILHSVAYNIVIPSDKLLYFWLHVYVNIRIIIYIVLRKSLFVFPKIWSILRNRIRDDDMALILLSAVQRINFVVSLHGSCNANF